MKRRKTKRKKRTTPTEPACKAGPRARSLRRERGSKKRERKPTVGRLEEKHGVGETFSEEHAEYDRIAEPQENATATPWRQRKTKKT